MRPRLLTVDVAGEGEPLVLIPGGITGWLSWIPHQERLSDRYRTIRVQPIHNEQGSAGIKGDSLRTPVRWRLRAFKSRSTTLRSNGRTSRDGRLGERGCSTSPSLIPAG